jgi:hypothetical protein
MIKSRVGFVVFFLGTAAVAAAAVYQMLKTSGFL